MYDSHGIALSILRQHHDPEPEVLDRFHYRDELVQIHRLGDVTIGVEVVALQHVLFVLRSRENDYRDVFQIVVGLDLSQHLSPIFLGKVEVEQDEIRARSACILPLPRSNDKASITMRSAYCGSTPMSLSRTAKSHSLARRPCLVYVYCGVSRRRPMMSPNCCNMVGL